MWLRLILFLGDAIDLDLFALAARDEQEQWRHDRHHPDSFIKPMTGGTPGLLNRITLHNVKN